VSLRDPSRIHPEIVKYHHQTIITKMYAAYCICPFFSSTLFRAVRSSYFLFVFVKKSVHSVDVLDDVCRVNSPVTIGPFSFSSHVTYPFFDNLYFVIIAFAIQRHENVEISSRVNPVVPDQLVPFMLYC
jgi:hypothetical protein